jgi:prepilin-type N-terminal cleavage/methylation domain-containing protein
MLKLNKKGFTLIELLVVIAIIGILASIVLVSLNDARNKGYDTQIKSDIAQVRNTVELCYDNQNGSYANCGVPNTNGVALIAPPACGLAYVVSVTATDYAVSGRLCSDNTLFWCVDTSGYSKTGLLTAGGTAAGACN